MQDIPEQLTKAEQRWLDKFNEVKRIGIKNLGKKSSLYRWVLKQRTEYLKATQFTEGKNMVEQRSRNEMSHLIYHASGKIYETDTAAATVKARTILALILTRCEQNGLTQEKSEELKQVLGYLLGDDDDGINSTLLEAFQIVLSKEDPREQSTKR